MPARIITSLAKVIGALIVIFAAYVVWSIVREGEARESARAFCARFPVGTSMADVAIAAVTEGDKWHRSIKDDRISVAHIGTFPFSRHVCSVEGQGGKVTSVRISHLD